MSNNFDPIDVLTKRYKELGRCIKLLKKLQVLESSLSKIQLMEYAKNIKPVLRGDRMQVELKERYPEGSELFFVPSFPIHTQSVVFTPHFPFMKAEELVEIARVKTYHRCGKCSGVFKPTIEDAIVQCPKKILDQVVAFEFVVPTLPAWRFYKPDLDRHVITTVYYTGTLPKEVSNQEVKW